ncbi:MAG TPA: response regulator, partial [Alphaproteobacteria bacterium]|nr:response regulator [Alphaproteobacteria bacterium]
MTASEPQQHRAADSGAKATVLFVDDEERILRSLKMLFRGRYDVLTASSGEEALALVRTRHVHVIVSDQRMPGMLGAALLAQVKVASPTTMRLLLTGYSDLTATI